MNTIASLKAFKILDSRANYTISVEINGIEGIAPAGASTGSHEIPYIDPEKAINYINKTLSTKLKGDIIEQKNLDIYLRNLADKIGGNGSIATSFSIYNNLWNLNIFLNNNQKNIFPFPLANVIGGGKHSGLMDIQEILVLPKKAKTFPEAVNTARNIYHEIGEYLKEKKMNYGMNDEGAHITPLPQEKALELAEETAKKHNAKIGIDMAASELWNQNLNKYIYPNSNKKLDPGEQIDYILDLIENYHLIYVEDPLHEEDFIGFSEILKKSNKTMITGDDLTTTNTSRIHKAIKNKSINSIIIKPNQIGTVTDTKEAVELSKKHNIIPVISHRSGETHDTTISRLSLDLETPIIKAGIADIRTVKLNWLTKQWNKTENPKMNKICIK